MTTKFFLLLVIYSSFVTAISHPYTPCSGGMADMYSCDNIDLLQRVHLDDMGGGSGSDIWGWTDPQDGKEYALMGLSTGTAFFDISAPTAPVYLGNLPTATSNSIWRDIKTYGDYAYIVSEASGHGMQIFDLTQLRNVSTPPATFTATANYTGFGSAHNIVINEDSGYAYAVGADCSGGLHMMDLTAPLTPDFKGCFSSDGYTHDAQCVLYIGPDSQHVGSEICFNSNEDTLTIVDVTNKTKPSQISRTAYDDSRYTHQGWLTEDQRYYLMNDELDEQNFGHNTKTYIWDLIDLDLPVLIGAYLGPQPSIDHNLYIKGNYAYLSNYTSGLSIVDITDIGNGNLVETAHFDTFPANNTNDFDGAWSNYPFFESGNVIVSDISGGLFILQPLLCPITDPVDGLITQPNGDNSIIVSWNDNLEFGETYSVYRSEGGCNADNFIKVADRLTTAQFNDDDVSGLVDIGYKVTKTSVDGLCETERSTCSESQTTGVCTAAPAFNGITAVTNQPNSTCSLNLQWNDASSYCESAISYNVYRSTDIQFVPAAENLLAGQVNSTSWTDYDVMNDQIYHYVVRAVDTLSNNSDNNTLLRSNKPLGEFKNGTWSVGAETGDTGIGQQTRHLGWELTTDQVFAGDRSYWSQDENNACNRLNSEPLQLTLGESSELSFYTYFDIEPRWDGGVVEISTDGNNWDMPGLTPNYPDTFRSSSDQCGYDENTPAFSGQQLSWQQHFMDLSAYQGEDVFIRFSYSTDGSVNEPGWYLDNIAVSNTQIPGQCETISDIIFIDDFE